MPTLDPASWIPDSIKNADEKTKPNLKTKVAPTGSARRSPMLGGIGLCVSNYSPNKEAAAQFVAWFNSKDVQTNKIVEAGGQPCRNSAWQANAERPSLVPPRSPRISRWRSRCRRFPEWGQVDTAISTQLTQAFAGEIKPKEALAAAQAGRRRGDEGCGLLLAAQLTFPEALRRPARRRDATPSDRAAWHVSIDAGNRLALSRRALSYVAPALVVSPRSSSIRLRRLLDQPAALEPDHPMSSAGPASATMRRSSAIPRFST